MIDFKQQSRNNLHRDTVNNVQLVTDESSLSQDLSSMTSSVNICSAMFADKNEKYLRLNDIFEVLF